MTAEQPLPRSGTDQPGFTREVAKYLERTMRSAFSTQKTLNIGPMRELIPQLGPIRRTDGITGYQAPVANQAIYVPFVVNADFWDVNGFHTCLAGALVGHVCMGIYSEAGTQLLTTGSLAVAQQMDATISPAIRLVRKRYWLGFAMDNITDQFSAFAGTPLGNDLVRLIASGVKAQATAFPLPATATFGNPTIAFLPAVYISIAAP